MHASNITHRGILKLPDEILLMVLKQLTIVDAFHSLMNASQRFRRLALDPLHIRALDLTNATVAGFLCEGTSSIDSQLHSRICHEILPQIHHHVHQLILDESSMTDVLAAGSYPRLSSLTLRNCDLDLLQQSLTGTTTSRKGFSHTFILDDAVLRALSKQIAQLKIDVSIDGEPEVETAPKVFASILSLCPDLVDMTLCSPLLSREHWTLVVSLLRKPCASTTLTRLRIDVVSLPDCITLLDGRFPRLTTLIVKIQQIFPTGFDESRIVSNTVSSFESDYCDFTVHRNPRCS